MDAKELATLLIERDPAAGLNQKVAVLSDRMALQIMSVPSLLAHWAEAAALEQNDGSVILQYGFLKLPEEVLPQLQRLLSTSYFEKSRLVKYIKNGQAMTGLEVTVEPDDLPGSKYQYAY